MDKEEQDTNMMIFRGKWVFGALCVRALRAPVFLGSLTRKTGRCAPPKKRCFPLETIPRPLRVSLSGEYFTRVRKLNSAGKSWLEEKSGRNCSGKNDATTEQCMLLYYKLVDFDSCKP
jgi:hypothetical protein